jgi:mannuronan 5-epimerase
MLVVVAVVVISISTLLPLSYGQQQNAIDSSAPCITYDSTDKIITITCDSARLTDIDNQIKDANILHKETTGGNHRVWLLNAGIVVAEGEPYYISIPQILRGLR